eukprot:791291-Rhodomonas_salina.4
MCCCRYYRRACVPLPAILGTPYAMSGTDLGYATTSRLSPSKRNESGSRDDLKMSVWSYASAMRCPVLT